MFRTLLEQIYALTFIPFFVLIIICIYFLCIVICMHSFHSTHIFIVYNSVICTKSFNILIYTAHFGYSPLNSYVYINWILDFNYILLIIITTISLNLVKYS